MELLGITLYKNVNFNWHIQNICRKANTKTEFFLRIRKFLNLEQAQVLAEAYILSNYRYCALIWMFCGKISDNLIVNPITENLGLNMIHRHDHMKNYYI